MDNTHGNNKFGNSRPNAIMQNDLINTNLAHEFSNHNCVLNVHPHGHMQTFSTSGKDVMLPCITDSTVSVPLQHMDTFSSSLSSPSNSTTSSHSVNMETFGSSAVDLNSVTPHSEVTKTKKKTAHVKRPLNSFMVFSKRERQKIVASKPKLHHAEISKRLGEKWRALTDEERRPYIDEAKRLSLHHLQENPDYKYRPKRKSKTGKTSSMASQKSRNFISGGVFYGKINTQTTVPNPHQQQQEQQEQQQQQQQQEQQQQQQQQQLTTTSLHLGQVRPIDSPHYPGLTSPGYASSLSSQVSPASTSLSDNLTRAASSPISLEPFVQCDDLDNLNLDSLLPLPGNNQLDIENVLQDLQCSKDREIVIPTWNVPFSNIDFNTGLAPDVQSDYDTPEVREMVNSWNQQQPFFGFSSGFEPSSNNNPNNSPL